jgi:dolichol-phosphate mannosyltransferase
MTLADLPVISVVTPAYNEAEGLPEMHRRLSAVLCATDLPWEWVVVDDHSSDGTLGVLEALIQGDPRVRAVRLSRNFGSHAAILAGARHCRGQCVIVMAADLQDPPELIPQLLEHWQAGSRTVWAVRGRREGESLATRLLSRLYYLLLRRMTQFADTPAAGADMWLMDRQVVEALNSDPERHASVNALVRWMGFRQSSIAYTKAARQFGRSKWSLARKVNHAINVFVASTTVPIRAMSYLGLLTSAAGLLYALVVLWNALARNPTEGWTSLMVVSLITSGIQMLMLGILGEYLWRNYEETRQRPRYIVEQRLNVEPPAPVAGEHPAGPRGPGRQAG